MTMTLSRSFGRLPRALLAGTLLACGLAAPVWAMPITKQLVVNVVTVCDNAGLNCASHGPAGNAFYENETDKIWAQAGIDINFIEAGTLNNSALLTGASGVADFTSALGGTGTTMYLTSDLFCNLCTLYGEAWVGAGGLVINMGAVNAFNAGVGRLDTIAHELGHNLGIGHPEVAQYLMAPGSIRNIPSNLGEICPDPDAASCFDLLPADQIAVARASDLLVDFVAVPEPMSLALVAVGLFTAGLARRRRRA